MTKEEILELENDTDGLKTYEFMANHLYELNDEQLSELVDNMARVDLSAQFLASGARYMNALDANRYASHINRMVALTIDRDREHRYIGDLIVALYGPDYADRAAELAAGDNNFRRMYKRLFPEGAL